MRRSPATAVATSLFSTATFPSSTFTFRMLKVLQRKLVVVGDGACGKTSLLLFFNNRQFHTVRNYIRATSSKQSPPRDWSLLTLLQIGTYTHSLWEHCKGFRSRWPACRACVIWYCRYDNTVLLCQLITFSHTHTQPRSRPGRLWSSTTSRLPWYTRCLDLLFRWYTRFPW